MMLHAKFQDHRTCGYEEDFEGLDIYKKKNNSHFTWRLHMKFGFDLQFQRCLNMNFLSICSYPLNNYVTVFPMDLVTK